MEVRLPDGWTDLGDGPDDSVSNFDGIIPDGLEDRLKAGGVYCAHYGAAFCGEVFYQDGAFYSDVWRYHSHVATLTAPTLAGVVAAANEALGAG